MPDTPTELRLGLAADGLDPTEDLLDPLTGALRYGIAKRRDNLCAAPGLGSQRGVRHIAALRQRLPEPPRVALSAPTVAPDASCASSTMASAASRSAVPVASVKCAATARPFLFSISTCPM